MNVEIYMVHASCPTVEEQFRNVGTLPNYAPVELTKEERSERADYICKYKMKCERCGDTIYVGADV